MGGYDKRGNMVLPVTNENGMNNVTLPEVTVTPRNINLAGAVDRGRREAAPYVSTINNYDKIVTQEIQLL